MSATDQATATVPDVVAPPPHHPRFPLLDGMRAIAVLLVVVLHVATFDGAGDSIFDRLTLHLNLGVTIFFLLSGFLLYRPFIAYRVGGPPAPRVLEYLKRRALRIIPAYWLVVTIVTLLPGLDAARDGTLTEQYLLIFTLTSSGGWTCPDCVLPQTWSLVVEVTFYLALPLYVLAADRLAAGRAARRWVPLELALLGGLALGSIVLQYVVYDAKAPTLIGGSLLSFGLWFALGMGLAIGSVIVGGPGQRVAGWLPRGGPELLWAAAGVAYLVLAIVLPASFVIYDVDQQLLAFVGLALVALLLLAPAITTSPRAGLPGRLLAWRPIEWVGTVSYGIFLWHVVVLRVLTDTDVGWSFLPLLVCTTAISIAVAAGSYYLLERPILRFKR